MAPKFKVKSKDEIPTELVNLYVQRDGPWLPDVDGMVTILTAVHVGRVCHPSLAIRPL